MTLEDPQPLSVVSIYSNDAEEQAILAVVLEDKLDQTHPFDIGKDMVRMIVKFYSFTPYL